MSILKRLKEKRVVSFELDRTQTMMCVMEECDQWYDAIMGKSEVKQLIDELNKLYMAMQDEGGKQ